MCVPCNTLIELVLVTGNLASMNSIWYVRAVNFVIEGANDSSNGTLSSFTSDTFFFWRCFRDVNFLIVLVSRLTFCAPVLTCRLRVASFSQMRRFFGEASSVLSMVCTLGEPFAFTARVSCHFLLPGMELTLTITTDKASSCIHILALSCTSCYCQSY